MEGRRGGGTADIWEAERVGRQEGVRVPQQSATCYFELVEGRRDEGGVRYLG